MMGIQISAGDTAWILGVLFSGFTDDAGTGAFLRWHGAAEKRPFHFNLELYLHGH